MSVRYVVDEQGKRVGVMLPIEEYESLLEELEEMENVRAYDETKAELERGEGELISWEKTKEQIGSEYEDQSQ